MNRPVPDQTSFAHTEDQYFTEKAELVELLMYPLVKRSPVHFEKIDWTLFNIWIHVCYEFRIDHELRYVYFDHNHSYSNQEPWEDEIDEVRRARGNSEQWIEKARQKMFDICDPLFSVIASREDYPKHYPRFKESQENMKNRSKSDDAILLPEYTEELQDILFTKLIELKFPIILDNKDSVFVVDRKKLTGYSEGKECTKLLCKVNTTSKLVHFYPIHDNEQFKYLKEYANPMENNSLYEMDEFDENEHLRGEVLSNLITIDNL